MWWRLGLLGLFDVLLVLVLFAPMGTTTVRVNLPKAGPHTVSAAPSPQAVQHGVELIGAVFGALLILALISLNVWLVKRILRGRDHGEHL